MAINSEAVALILITSSFVLFLSFLLAIYFSKKSAGKDDWDVGGRNLPLYVIVGTQYASAIGGGVLVAHVGIGYTNGWATLTYGFLVSIGFVILSWIAKWLREQEFTTIPDVLVKLYGEQKVLIIFASLMTIVAPLAALATSLVAFGKLFSVISGIPANTLIIIFAFINVLFVLPAGLKSVAWSDFIFGCLMVAITIFTSFYAINFAGGWSKIAALVPKDIVSFPGGMWSIGGLTFFLWALSLIPGTLTMQMYYQRIFAVDKVSNARKSLLASAAVILTVEIFAGVLGLAIRSINPALKAEEAAGWFLTQIPNWYLAIYSAFIIVTLLSTVDSLIQSCVVNVTNDIYKKVINPQMSGKDHRKLSIIFSFVTAAVGVLAAIVYPEALGWLMIGYSYSAACLLFPIFLGFALKDKTVLNVNVALSGILGGVAGCVWGQTLGSATKIPYVGYGLLASLVCMLAATVYYTKQSKVKTEA